MVRTIVGVFITLVCFYLDSSLGIASGVVTGVWVLLGVGTLVGAAAEKPTEHRVRVHGAVAHVVIDPRDTSIPNTGAGAVLPAPQSDERPQVDPRRDRLVECPRCSQYVFLPAKTCSCGWVVPAYDRRAEDASDSMRVASDPTPPPVVRDTAALADRLAPRVSPACPQCRAPTAWVAEYERFFCSRCDVYL